MRRVLIVALVLLMASAASAQWYLGVKFAGTMDNNTLFDAWYYYDRDLLGGDNDGVIDNTQVIFGYGMDSIDLELSLGYNKQTLKYEDPDSDYTDEMNLTAYILGLTGFYHMMGNDTMAVDGGLRFQLETDTWDYDASDRDHYTWEDKLSGWALGPVLRGRIFFADGAMALGPEIFFKYSSKKYTEDEDYNSRVDYEMDVTGMGIDYGLRLDFLF
jgi:hypothetical protein